MQHSLRTMFAALLILTGFVSLQATGLVEEPPPPRPVTEFDHSLNVLLGEIPGEPVILDGGQVGTIRDTVVDIGAGSVAYLVVRFEDETIGSPDALYPFPTHLFAPSEAGFRLLTDNEAYFRNMPTLEDVRTASASAAESGWEDWVYLQTNRSVTVPSADAEDRRFYLQRFRYRYGGGPQVVPGASLLGSELRGLPVYDADGRRVGGVLDAVVNLDASQLLLLDVAPSDRLTDEADGFLVPLSAFVANKETVRVSYDLEELGFGGPSAYAGSRPDFADASYHERLADYWNARETRYAVGMRVIPVRMTPATFITTFELYTQNRDSQGEIVDVIVEPDGTVDYAVIALEGFFGFGNRRIVAPVSLLTVSPVSNAAVLNVRAADIDEVPMYRDGRTIDTTAEGWDEPIVSYWNNLFAVEMGDTDVGTIPTVSSAAAIPPGRPIPASAMIGGAVTAAEANATGTIQDLYVDLVDGRVGFATLGIDGIGTIPVPVAAVEREAAGGFVLDANRERIDEAPGIDAIPLTPNVEFLDEIESYWGGR